MSEETVDHVNHSICHLKHFTVNEHPYYPCVSSLTAGAAEAYKVSIIFTSVIILFSETYNQSELYNKHQ